jgi:hypothetical protein
MVLTESDTVVRHVFILSLAPLMFIALHLANRRHDRAESILVTQGLRVLLSQVDLVAKQEKKLIF